MKKTLIALTVLLAACSKTADPDLAEGGDRPEPEWIEVCSDVTATVYNAVAAQCNADYLHTASMFRIIPERILEQRVLAMERTMMAQYGISYGDTVRVEGTGRWDGEWQVQDTMNKRFAGQHKVDLLVPSHIRHGKWDGVRILRRTRPSTLYGEAQ